MLVLLPADGPSKCRKERRLEEKGPDRLDIEALGPVHVMPDSRAGKNNKTSTLLDFHLAKFVPAGFLPACLCYMLQRVVTSGGGIYFALG